MEEAPDGNQDFAWVVELGDDNVHYLSVTSIIRRYIVWASDSVVKQTNNTFNGKSI
jgi:hypothetical protein